MNICNKLNETKVIRDPIYSYIQVDYQIIWDLLATFEMQRLRRILQLAGTNYVFPELRGPTRICKQLTYSTPFPCAGIARVPGRGVEEAGPRWGRGGDHCPSGIKSLVAQGGAGSPLQRPRGRGGARGSPHRAAARAETESPRR